MKHKFFSAIMALVAFSFMACANSDKTAKIGDRQGVVRSLDSVPYFNKIVLDGILDVEFTQADYSGVKVEGAKEIVKNVLVKVEGKTLVLELSKKDYLRFDRSKKAKVFVSSPDILSVVLKGAGSFCSENPVDTDTLDVQLLGSGNIEFDDIVCDQASFNVRGAGNIEVDNLTAQTSNVSLLGVGNMDIHFRNSGDVTCNLQGVGTLEFDGNVRSFNVNKQGTGVIDTEELKVGK